MELITVGTIIGVRATWWDSINKTFILNCLHYRCKFGNCEWDADTGASLLSKVVTDTLNGLYAACFPILPVQVGLVAAEACPIYPAIKTTWTAVLDPTYWTGNYICADHGYDNRAAFAITLRSRMPGRKRYGRVFLGPVPFAACSGEGIDPGDWWWTADSGIQNMVDNPPSISKDGNTADLQLIVCNAKPTTSDPDQAVVIANHRNWVSHLRTRGRGEGM